MDDSGVSTPPENENALESRDLQSWNQTSTQPEVTDIVDLVKTMKMAKKETDQLGDETSP